MPDSQEQPVSGGASQVPQQAPAQSAASASISQRYESRRARGRSAEERSWREAGLFEQMKQGLEKDGSGQTPTPIQRI